MKKYFVLLCSILTACSGLQTVEDENVFRMDFRSILEKNSIEEMFLNEWCKDYRVVLLEGKDSAQIKDIKRIILKEDKILIMHDHVSLFDLDGKYLNEIGKKGDAMEEYSRLFGLNVWNDTIFITAGNFDLKLYDWKGEFLKNRQLPKFRTLQDLCLIPETDTYLGYFENRSGQTDMRFLFFRDTTILKSVPNFEKYEKVTDIMVWGWSPEMKSFDGGVFAFKELYNDTIYQVDSLFNLLPYAIADLGDYKASKEYIFSLTLDLVFKKDFDQFDGKIALTPTGEKDDIIYLAHYNRDYPYTFSFDKKIGKSSIQKILYPDNQYDFKEGSTFVPRFISTDGKYLIDYEMTKSGNNPVIVLVER